MLKLLTVEGIHLWIASLGKLPLAHNDRGPLAMTGGLARNDGEPSLRAAKWRSNPHGEGPRTGLLRSAMCRSLAMTGSVVIASREAAKQSSRGKPSHWIASLGNVPLARNDG
ncbi:MAG: hypothetical protein LBT00_06505 [Spirochaetaceae bacterium]|nr:hypothetical protein [Spirochaetaceae bacterium]